jgi:alkylated DNA repair dioxygenase AlkB
MPSSRLTPPLSPLANFLPKDGEVFYTPRVFEPEECDHYLSLLKDEVAWAHEPIKLFGKSVMQPRLTAWLDDKNRTYSYSGISMSSQHWPTSLIEIRHRAEQHAGVKFTSALLNYYRGGSDSMGWHQDNEKELGPNPIIGSVSFGAERVFQLKHTRDTEAKVSILLENGSFLLMAGKTQHFWKHQIPKTKRVQGPRINLTFRILRS